MTIVVTYKSKSSKQMFEQCKLLEATTSNKLTLTSILLMEFMEHGMNKHKEEMNIYASGSQTFYTKYHLRKYLAFQVLPL